VILSDSNIRTYLAEGKLAIVPLGDDAIRPASVDLRLGPLLTIPDPNSPDGWRTHDLREAPYRLYQGGFVLGHTLEWIELPPWLAGVLAGKSSRAREGLIVESAGYVDPGWRGEVTVEMANLAPAPFILTDGTPIAQIRLEMLLTPAERDYSHPEMRSHYQDSRGPVPSRMGGRTS
jgi:dCTP deaminase